MKLKQANSEEIEIPTKLPLLESLCWNINNPYRLNHEQMLALYEERWRFKGVLGNLEPEESFFIKKLIARYKGLPLIDMNNKNKEAVFKAGKTILARLDNNLLHQHRVVLGGGALIGMLHGQLRYSRDLDFLIAPQDYNKLAYRLRSGESVFAFQDNLEVSEPRIDRYGIRYPVRVKEGGEKFTFKVEIISEWNMQIDTPESIYNIACLNECDRISAKLLANVDRGYDSSKFSRDLIDLAIIASQSKIPSAAIDKATGIYPDALSALIKSIQRFQDYPNYRDKCYENLQINRPEVIIDGIDYLAKKCSLKPTQRTFKETDFSYLDPEPKTDNSTIVRSDESER